MAKHTAHGYLVDDVYKEAEDYTRIFGHHPSRIDETFAGFRFDDNKEFFLWQWKHIEEHVGEEVMKKVKYRDQQALRCETIEEFNQVCQELKTKGVPFISEPKNYTWNARCVYFLDNSGHMWEIFLWTGNTPLGDLEPEKMKER